MAIGKSKKQYKRGTKKRLIDPLSRKEWFDFKAPVPFQSKSFGKTLVTKTTGTKIATEQIKGRVVEQSLADLKEKTEQSFAWRKVKLIIDEVEGRNAITTFYGVDTTSDKINRTILKWHTLIDAFNDVKSADGYILRVFTTAFTKRQPKQIKVTSYAQNSQVRQIRAKITEILNSKISKQNINDITKNLIQDNWTQDISEACKYIYPLREVIIRKVKVLKRPKIDAIKLKEMYQHDKKGIENKGGRVDNDEDAQAENTLTKEKRAKRN